jgi:hypothetical protein
MSAKYRNIIQNNSQIYDEWLHYSKDQTAKIKYHRLRWKGCVKKKGNLYKDTVMGLPWRMMIKPDRMDKFELDNS